MTEMRTGQAPAVLTRPVFHERFMQAFMDPAFRAEEDAIGHLEDIAYVRVRFVFTPFSKSGSPLNSEY